MTDARKRRPPVTAVYAVAGALFVGGTGGLAVQMASGHDPALGTGKTAVAKAPVPPRRRVLIRRIEKTIIVTRVVPASSAPRRPGAAPAVVTSAPVVSRAPVAVAPAPTPAPVPAPVVTKSS